MSNNLPAKKLGEVQAFATIGLELLERGGETADKAFGPVLAAEMRTTLAQQLDYVRPLADSEKADRTTLKLRGMMEQYIGDSWDNPIELLEWSGFYLGAAGIHWSLITGLEADADVITNSQGQADQFTAWLAAANLRIKEGAALND